VQRWDVIVVGGGHAGAEAAWSAAAMGCRVAMVTLGLERIGEMPCNPAMGGIGKGHLVAEVDALGGLQGWLTDRAGIQFRRLNASRGPAVWGPRAQCDKARYRRLMRQALEGVRGLDVVEGEVERLLTVDGGVAGVGLVGGEGLRAGAVVLTTGTFLGAVLHTGGDRRAGGRRGEGASAALGEDLQRLGLGLRRFKTGTPPRVHRDSLDYERMVEQEGDARPRPFSWRSAAVRNRCSCWLTRTPEVVQQIVEENLDRSPLFTGKIEGVGPRYCPSIEDKVVRFPHHRQHTVFVEPEGLQTPVMYVNGLSTSLPEDVQARVVRAVPGLERARIVRFGYAVEYDVVGPGQVDRSLASKSVPGLYFAGQVMGTSGYEEAAAQGWVAGVNAVRWLRGRSPVVVGREQGYVGVLVDDLVSRRHEEPYRMLTARAEHRLILGVDSARERLMRLGVELGLVPEAVFHVEQRRWAARAAAREGLRQSRLNPNEETRRRVRELAGCDLRRPSTWADVLRRQDVDAEAVAAELPMLGDLDGHERAVVVGLLRYDGYVERSERERERVARLRQVAIPEDLDVGGIAGLSREVREVLVRQRPRTLADAERLPGVTPVAVALLAARLGRPAG
jgi:tRNA uridine 5-carboxymethylaminomethyl modification enzyme